jgi:hypothetical protein
MHAIWNRVSRDGKCGRCEASCQLDADHIHDLVRAVLLATSSTACSLAKLVRSSKIKTEFKETDTLQDGLLGTTFSSPTTLQYEPHQSVDEMIRRARQVETSRNKTSGPAPNVRYISPISL